MSETVFPSWSDFAGRDGSVCTVIADIAEYAFTLEHAEKLGETARPGGSFRLTFRGPGEPILPQGIYRVMADDFDAEMFLVPVGRDESGTAYEAIFN
jgi:hypothetical protein